MSTNDMRNAAEIAEYRARSAAARLVSYAERLVAAPPDVLYQAADEIDALIIERDNARAHRAYLWGACVALFGMLLWDCWPKPAPAPCPTAEVMQLDPMEIRAAPRAAEWL